MKGKSIWQTVDWVTIAIYLALMFMGWISIYTAVYNEEHKSIFDMSQRYGKQLLWIVFSLVIALFVIVIDGKFFATFAYPIYGFFLLLLVAVLFLGKEVNGSRSWFEFGSVALQPAEFAKLGTSLAIAKFMSSFNFKLQRKNSLGWLAVILGTPIVLILLQNDLGSALVYVSFLIAFYREGLSGLVLFFGLSLVIVFILSLVLSPLAFLLVLLIPVFIIILYVRKNGNEFFSIVTIWAILSVIIWGISLLVINHRIDLYFILIRSSLISGLLYAAYSYYKGSKFLASVCLFFLGALFVSFSVEFVFDNFLEPHHQARVNDMLGIESDPLGAGYNVNQSKIAIGSGGFFGKGFLKGTQTKFEFVPEQDTDFIFCTVGEEWGFIGSMGIISLFIYLIYRLIFLAERQRSVFSRVFGYLVASILFFHFTVNIAMTMGLFPVIGIPLPFFSYGGSSLWFFTLLLFVFLKLDTSRFEKL